MHANIDNKNLFERFLHKQVGPSGKLTISKARELGIDTDKVKAADLDGEDDVTIDEIIEDSELYEEFATLYVQEQKKEQAAEDEEQKKKKLDEARTANKEGSKNA